MSASASTVAATTPSITETPSSLLSGSAKRTIAAQPNTIDRLLSCARAWGHRGRRRRDHGERAGDERGGVHGRLRDAEHRDVEHGPCLRKTGIAEARQYVRVRSVARWSHIAPAMSSASSPGMQRRSSSWLSMLDGSCVGVCRFDDSVRARDRGSAGGDRRRHRSGRVQVDQEQTHDDGYTASTGSCSPMVAAGNRAVAHGGPVEDNDRA